MNRLLIIVNEILASIGVEQISKLEKSLRLREDLEIDSITFAELVVLVDNEFEVNIHEGGDINTLGDIMKLL